MIDKYATSMGLDIKEVVKAATTGDRSEQMPTSDQSTAAILLVAYQLGRQADAIERLASEVGRGLGGGQLSPAFIEDLAISLREYMKR